MGEGWSERNLEIMQTLGSSLVALNQPFVIMGDFNMSPSEFAQGEFLNHVNAAVVAPDTDTFKQGSNSSCIDFFVVAPPCSAQWRPCLSSTTTGGALMTLYISF